MGGLARILKMYGSMVVTDASGKKAVWIYDYANNKARLKSDMNKEELAANEKAKYQQIKKQQ